MQSAALLSPRQLKAAVVNYDSTLLQKNPRWGDMSVLQKFYYLFETILEMESQLKKAKLGNVPNASSSGGGAESNHEESMSMSRGGTITVLSHGPDQKNQRPVSQSEASYKKDECIQQMMEECEQLRNQILHKVS